MLITATSELSKAAHHNNDGVIKSISHFYKYTNNIYKQGVNEMTN